MADKFKPGGQDDAGSVLEEARRCIRRGDGWQASPSHYDRLRQHCSEIGIHGEPNITLALRACLCDEITVQDLRVRDDPAYDGLLAGLDLYQASWFSRSIRRNMYLKFSLFDGRLIIVSFHESTKA